MGSEADGALFALQVEGLAVYDGIDSQFVDQLIEKSREPHVQATTPRDGAERFADFDHFVSWHNQNPDRKFFVVAEGLELAGAAWFTPIPEPESDLPPLSFALRLYHGYAGRRLARHVMAATHGRMAKSELAASGVQLEADRQNQPAICSYRHFGYHALQAATTSQERIRMVLSPERLAELIVAK
jgi:hypothetical protein